jgi:glycogen(starch) synthase
MRILLCSTWFYPSFGGIETISKLLAEEFTKAGASVTVVTSTPGPEMDAPYFVVRQPPIGQLRQLARQCDVIFQNLISLRTLLPIITMGKPVVVTHGSWLRRNDGTRGLENYAKLMVLRFCQNVAISKAIADALPVPSIRIGNPFEAQEFESFRGAPKDKDIVFMGRLVSDKGCDILVQALGQLATKGIRPSVTIIGDGPEAPKLKSMVADLKLDGQIEFRGVLREGRGKVVARHRIMAIPSIWAEPFGVVALEGIAAGCAVVASDRGGLPDSVGPCGLYFPNRNVELLAQRLETLLTDSAVRAQLVSNGPAHLLNFQPGKVAAEYLDLFARLISGQTGKS